MKKLVLVFSLLFTLTILLPITGKAQFRSQRDTPSISDKIGIPYSPSNSSLVLGFIDPSKLDMQQSYSLSFVSGGHQSGALGLYTNRMSYMINPDLQLIADIGYLHQPFQSFGNMPNLFDSGQFFYGGELRYRPTDNTYLSIRLDNMPRSYWNRGLYYNRYTPMMGY